MVAVQLWKILEQGKEKREADAKADGGWGAGEGPATVTVAPPFLFCRM